jgi:hypothetical protein
MRMGVIHGARRFIPVPDHRGVGGSGGIIPGARLPFRDQIESSPQHRADSPGREIGNRRQS